MQLPLLSLPRAIPLINDRPPQDSIPPTREERERVRDMAERYVADHRLVIPLSFEELKTHADALSAHVGLDAKFRDYVAVVISSEANREALATVPYERRLLLLPKCLRVEDRCPAPFDEFGLLCKQCGLCTIQDLQAEAERLGYAVLVAEGSALVMAIIQTGKIDAIVGVSCLSVLEKAFPYMEAAAIPGVAIPLLQDDCKDTGIDLEWVWDYIHLTSDDRTYRLDLNVVRQQVDEWFSPAALAAAMGPAESESDQIARAWLSKDGKRWRPFLSACIWIALHNDAEAELPTQLRDLAIGVECFHKASLVHDDIEDQDDIRYGEKTVHAEHGVAVALNVGDLLLGEGYRMISGCDAPPAVLASMIRIAAEGHRTLCQGQGSELLWARAPRPLSPVEVAEIHRRKTAPAFAVALRIGAAFADATPEVHDILNAYSEALGIAYQIRDDLEDIQEAGAGDDLCAGRPSFPLAVAYERARGTDRDQLEKVWRRESGINLSEVRAILERLGALERSSQILETYKDQAIRVLANVDDPNLKGLLRRVVTRIFRMDIKEWCSEFEARNATGSEAITQVVG